MGSPSGVEIEAKLVVVGDAREELFEKLMARAEFAGTTVGAFETLEFVDRYFDFEGGLLAKEGCALRLREVRGEAGNRVLLTFKGRARVGEGLGVERPESEEPWSLSALEGVLARIRSMGLEPREHPESKEETPAGALASLGLQLVQERGTRRHAARLHRDQVPVAELALDRVRFGSAPNEVSHHEIEVEARGASDVTEVNRIVRWILEEWGGSLLPWRWSKTALGRALEELVEGGESLQLTDERGLSSGDYARIDAELASRT